AQRVNVSAEVLNRVQSREEAIIIEGPDRCGANDGQQGCCLLQFRLGVVSEGHN
ncbi:MAG: hypothetical protein QOJ18_1217, partial [Microbacteriaceae bacterium]|nr:hypothetical protein [Microbacteriaceae bacterium]